MQMFWASTTIQRQGKHGSAFPACRRCGRDTGAVSAWSSGRSGVISVISVISSITPGIFASRRSC